MFAGEGGGGGAFQRPVVSWDQCFLRFLERSQNFLNFKISSFYYAEKGELAVFFFEFSFLIDTALFYSSATVFFTAEMCRKRSLPLKTFVFSLKPLEDLFTRF